MVGVVCTAFVVVFLALGIVRFRAAQQRAAREDLQAEIEMAWDDSALNITVNPLEVRFHKTFFLCTLSSASASSKRPHEYSH